MGRREVCAWPIDEGLLSTVREGQQRMNILPDGSAFDIVTMTSRYNTWWKRWRHYLFDCPTFWLWKPRFTCPDCGANYRCYWDGNDVGGKVDVCNECASKYE
jgi:hypothetical protein